MPDDGLARLIGSGLDPARPLSPGRSLEGCICGFGKFLSGTQFNGFSCIRTLLCRQNVSSGNGISLPPCSDQLFGVEGGGYPFILTHRFSFKCPGVRFLWFIFAVGGGGAALVVLEFAVLQGV